jgi:acyl-CoA synthetase (AMP-forming)/AMP-acid ligase II
MFIGDWLARGELYWPDALAIVDVARGEAGRFTYRALNARANRVARRLREAGVGEGDRVGLLALNGVEYLDLFFACCKLGATFVPFNWRSHPRELAALGQAIAPRALVFDAELRDAALELLAACPDLRLCAQIGGDAAPPAAAYEPLAAEGPAPPVARARVDAEDIACLLFTGGTTGLPKAARVSLRMIAWNTLSTVVHELQRGDVTLTHTPMFHTGGLLVYTLPLLTLGGTVVVMRKWAADAMLELIERERITVLFCVPTQYQMMLESERFARTSHASLRFLTSGGAPLPVPVVRAYREAHGVVFKQGFGMTEFGPGVFSMSPEYAEAKTGSIGRPNYFVEAQIVDDDGRPLPAGEAGELVLRGPACCSGYFGDASSPLDAEGWFHTGDLARTDDDGFFFVVDRKKDMFISGGENVYPLEIERALDEHPAVARCAVIGVPDPKWGEVGRAVVVLGPEAKARASSGEAAQLEQELIEHCRARLARYKVPRSVVFVDELPLSAAGKILKRELRTRFG